MTKADNKPFPAGCEIGSHQDVYHQHGGLVRTKWWCMFDWDNGMWTCSYVADDTVTDITGAGYTPREAFEQLVNRWSLLNGGESPCLRHILPDLRSVFEEDGSMSAGDLELKEVKGAPHLWAETYES